ncbi:MAG: GNAT family N-acetyltransferase [Oscillospiraceae bacterium]|nr:GNAT family N-acetyltransferase [Oscillospiraceae bacterium]
MTDIYLIRHAEAEGNIFRRAHGRYDSPLTARGLLQLERLSARLAPVPLAHIYTSPLARARRTASSLSSSAPVTEDARLIEMSLGDWEDKPWGEVMLKDPLHYSRFSGDFRLFAKSGAEDMRTVTARMTEVFHEIAARHKGQSVAAVTHGMALRCLLTALARLPGGSFAPYCDNASVTTVRVRDGDAVVEALGESGFLGELSTFSKQRWWKEGNALRDPELWYKPVAGERAIRVAVRRQRDAWERVYGDGGGFGQAEALRRIRALIAENPRCAQFVMAAKKRAGLLLLTADEPPFTDGHIALIALDEQYTGKGLGVQLLGEAVSYFRACGKTGLRLRVWPQNARAVAFYARHGFEKIGEHPSSRGILHLMRRPI